MTMAKNHTDFSEHITSHHLGRPITLEEMSGIHVYHALLISKLFCSVNSSDEGMHLLRRRSHHNDLNKKN